MSDPKDEKKLFTPLARLSFPNLFKARPKYGRAGQGEEFSCTLIFDAVSRAHPETTARMAAMSKAVQEVIAKEWGSKVPGNLHLPVLDGATQEYDGYGPGTKFIRLKSQRKPSMVNAALEPIIEPEEMYSGCYVWARVSCFSFKAFAEGSTTTILNQGVLFGLRTLQKVREGERLDGSSKAEDDFSRLEDGATDVPAGKPLTDLFA